METMKKITQKQVEKAWETWGKAQDEAWGKAWDEALDKAQEALDEVEKLEDKFKEQENKK